MKRRERRGIEESPISTEAGEWAVVAMACVAFADGVIDRAEIDEARAAVERTAVIRETLGPEFASQLFLDRVERLRGARDSELRLLKDELRQLASSIRTQEERDAAFHTLLRVAAADGEVAPAERTLLLELRDIVGSTLIVPAAHRSC
jgi:tellurite resistance protein